VYTLGNPIHDTGNLAVEVVSFFSHRDNGVEVQSTALYPKKFE
jgi:hypothetical protein